MIILIGCLLGLAAGGLVMAIVAKGAGTPVQGIAHGGTLMNYVIVFLVGAAFG